ncbi:MAG: rod shape-determining protein MreD [Actinomycetota bacterium]|nr:rod shape-determining protein MreD [Actinomycetota bacterium]
MTRTPDLPATTPGPRVAVAAAAVTVALLVQLSVLARLPLPGATPDLVTLVVVGLALVHGPGFGAGAGFGAGLALDLVPPADHAIGRWAFALTLAGYLVGLLRDDADRSAVIPVVASAAATAGATLVFTGLGALLGDPRVAWSSVAAVLPSAAAYATLLSPFVVAAVVIVARRSAADPAYG